MDLLPILQTYFQGERALGLAFLGMSAGVLAAAAWAWRSWEGPFVWGLAVPLVLFGLATAGGGIALAQRSQTQLETFSQQLEEAPAQLIQAETQRMARVNANWIKAKTSWAVLIAIALALIFGVRAPWAEGVGLALLTIATLLMYVDVTAEMRATPYTQALHDAGGGGAADP